MKYKLTEKYIENLGVKLFQIQAVTDFGRVSKGELGGYIQSEQCLSQSGNAWVSGNAQVYGNAHVSGDAQVSGNALVFGNAKVLGDAWVYGNARVLDNAQVYGNAQVSGDAFVYGNALVFGDAQVSGNALVLGDAWVYGRNSIFFVSGVGTENGTLTVCSGKDGLVVTRGCFTGTKEVFLAKSAKVHDEKTQREYRLLIEVAESRIKHHKAPECNP